MTEYELFGASAGSGLSAGPPAEYEMFGANAAGMTFGEESAADGSSWRKPASRGSFGKKSASGGSFGRKRAGGGPSGENIAGGGFGQKPAGGGSFGKKPAGGGSLGKKSGSGGSFGGQTPKSRSRRKTERALNDSAFGPVFGRSADLPPEQDPDEAAPAPWSPSGFPDDAPHSGAGTADGSSGRSRRRGRGEATPEDPADQAQPSDPLALGRSIVLRQLAMAPRSRHQLAVKLAERGVPEEAATAVLNRFEEVQLIDDAEFARMWVRSRSATRSLARSALKRELAEKGIDPALAEDALAQVSDDDERNAARELIHRKMRQGVDLGDRSARDKEVRRLVSMLARKGYAPGLAFALVKDALDAQDAASE
ncbi:regulatory protein RecX [Arthrobacter zhaoguopingii]|uniref:regulatory protein RecX n=1 Tax=Arthrobacter zhaoguopingii TaxID=2681491 RepID=UPI001FEF72C8|nr:regulatory protein RecX [Arthrobacter zhaoguopingii]